MKSEHFEEFDPNKRKYSLRITMTENEARELFYGWHVSAYSMKMQDRIKEFLKYVDEESARDE